MVLLLDWIMHNKSIVYTSMELVEWLVCSYHCCRPTDPSNKASANTCHPCCKSLLEPTSGLRLQGSSWATSGWDCRALLGDPTSGLLFLCNLHQTWGCRALLGEPTSSLLFLCNLHQTWGCRALLGELTPGLRLPSSSWRAYIWIGGFKALLGEPTPGLRLPSSSWRAYISSWGAYTWIEVSKIFLENLHLDWGCKALPGEPTSGLRLPSSSWGARSFGVIAQGL